MPMDKFYLQHPELGWVARLQHDYLAEYKSLPEGPNALAVRSQYAGKFFKNRETPENIARLTADYTQYKDDALALHKYLLATIDSEAVPGDDLSPATRQAFVLLSLRMEIATHLILTV
jgi:hypothetical protein